MAVVDQFKALLPVQLQEYWYLVLIMGALILLLILINLPKLFKKKNPHVEAFKSAQQPPPMQQRPTAKGRDFKQLDQYIRAQLDAGFAPYAVRSTLLRAGWDAATVDASIARVQAMLRPRNQ